MNETRAFNEGWMACYETYTHNIPHARRATYRPNPYEVGSPAFVNWGRGWSVCASYPEMKARA